MGPFQSMKYLSQTRKVGSWYNDEVLVLYSSIPWIRRGGYLAHGTGAGIFNFHSSYGYIDSGTGFRLVLAL